jgi:hypothetical protein
MAVRRFQAYLAFGQPLLELHLDEIASMPEGFQALLLCPWHATGVGEAPVELPNRPREYRALLRRLIADSNDEIKGLADVVTQGMDSLRHNSNA